MNRIFTFTLVALTLTLNGCATYSTDECASGDWKKIGLQDGRDGHAQERFDRHGKACSLDRTEESRARYMAGRQKGLALYCTAVRGYREAALGQKYYGVCPPETAPLFSKGFQLGSRINQLEKQISEANNAYFTVSRKLQNSSLPETQREGLQREQARRQGDEQRLRTQLKQLTDKADTMVRAARSKDKS